MKFAKAETKLWLNSQTGYYAVKYKDARGKWQRKTLATKERREAVRLYNAWRRDYLGSQLVDRDPLASHTVAAFVEEWLQHIETRHKGSTFIQYRATGRNITANMGRLPL